MKLNSILLSTIFTLATQNALAMGPGRSGGGSGINYQIVEEFSERVQDLKGFNEYLYPVLQELKQKYPIYAMELEEKAAQIVWYVVPVDLPALTGEVTQLPFSSSLHAIHINNEVFINKNVMDEKTIESAGYLILHEINMGLHIAAQENYALNARRVNQNLPAGHQMIIPTNVATHRVRLATTAVRQRLFNSNPRQFARHVHFSQTGGSPLVSAEDIIRYTPDIFGLLANFQKACAKQAELEVRQNQLIEIVRNFKNVRSSTEESRYLLCINRGNANCTSDYSSQSSILSIFALPFLRAIGRGPDHFTTLDGLVDLTTLQPNACALANEEYEYNLRLQDHIRQGKPLSDFEFRLKI